VNYNLNLFFFPECPYCRLVTDKIEQLGIKNIQYSNTRTNDAFREKLIKDTGRSTVPCLYINDKPMHESSDIVKWLESHKSEL
jgi:glutaredoxin